jgi:hypothetical protein
MTLTQISVPLFDTLCYIWIQYCMPNKICLFNSCWDFVQIVTYLIQKHPPSFKVNYEGHIFVY